jgi:hypothetical protein
LHLAREPSFDVASLLTRHSALESFKISSSVGVAAVLPALKRLRTLDLFSFGTDAWKLPPSVTSFKLGGRPHTGIVASSLETLEAALNKDQLSNVLMSNPGLAALRLTRQSMLPDALLACSRLTSLHLDGGVLRADVAILPKLTQLRSLTCDMLMQQGVGPRTQRRCWARCRAWKFAR